MCDIGGTDAEAEKLPPDFEDSMEYVLENLMNQQESYILVLRYMRGLTYREIGDYYGLPLQRVRQIIDKSLRRLRHPRRYRLLKYGLAQCLPLSMEPEYQPNLGCALDDMTAFDIVLPKLH